MMAGPIEEAGSTARSLFESMRESPVTLSLVIFNIVFLGIMYFSLSEERDSRNKLIDIMATTNKDTAVMLYNCTASRMPAWAPVEEPGAPLQQPKPPTPPAQKK